MQAVQAAHALLAFAVENPGLTGTWHEDSSNLVILSVPDEAALLWLIACAEHDDILCTPFREPDLDDALTAVAIEPAGWRLCSSYPLALREAVMS